MDESSRSEEISSLGTFRSARRDDFLAIAIAIAAQSLHAIVLTTLISSASADSWFIDHAHWQSPLQKHRWIKKPNNKNWIKTSTGCRGHELISRAIHGRRESREMWLVNRSSSRPFESARFPRTSQRCLCTPIFSSSRAHTTERNRLLKNRSISKEINIYKARSIDACHRLKCKKGILLVKIRSRDTRQSCDDNKSPIIKAVIKNKRN